MLWNRLESPCSRPVVPAWIRQCGASRAEGLRLMKWVHIAGLTNPVSRIVLGGPFGERSDVESFCLLDRFLELGGTTIETAHSYANGAAEKQIGRWLRTREDRKSVVVITKVCHPREGQPSSMSDFDEEFDISQERLGVSS